MNKLATIRLLTLWTAAAVGLAACGGSGDDDPPAPGPAPAPAPGPAPAPAPEPPPPAPPPPETETLTGQVTRNSTLKNVVVCLDLNANDTCDVGEPASSPTGEDGRYSLTFEKSAVTPAQLVASSLIAPVVTGDEGAPTTAVDMVAPTARATSSSYVLKRPAGTTGNINPLTTLLHAGVTAGMTDAVARDNVAKQLGIAAAKIEDYQDDPPTTALSVPDTARSAASVVANALRDKASLEVGDQSAAVAAGAPMLNNLRFSDAGNYYLQTLDIDAKAAGTEGRWITDARSGKADGVAHPDWGAPNALYRTAYLTPQGWKQCGRDAKILTTIGSPSRSTVCDARISLGYSTASSVEGQAMGDLVTRWQGQPSNSINVGGALVANLLAALGNTTFPSGSAEMKFDSVVVEPGLMISDTWSRSLPQTRTTTVQGLPAAYPISAVNLATGANTLSLGNGTGVDKTMRVAFGAASSPTAGVAQYYQCDLDAVTQLFANPPNCVATAEGSYTIETIHGAPVMRFVGAPDTIMTFNVVYSEIDWGGANNRWVYRAHELKPSASARRSVTNRLNGSAWAAMKSQLGL